MSTAEASRIPVDVKCNAVCCLSPLDTLKLIFLKNTKIIVGFFFQEE